MTDQPVKRRDFLQTTAAAAGGIVLASPAMVSAEPSEPTVIEEPFTAPC